MNTIIYIVILIYTLNDFVSIYALEAIIRVCP